MSKHHWPKLRVDDGPLNGHHDGIMKNRQTEPRVGVPSALLAWLPGGPLEDRLMPEFKVTVRDLLAGATGSASVLPGGGNPTELAAGQILRQLTWLGMWNFQPALTRILTPLPGPLPETAVNPLSLDWEGMKDAKLEEWKCVDQHQDLSPTLGLIHANPQTSARQGIRDAHVSQGGLSIYRPY